MLRRGEEWAQYDKAVTWVVFTFLIALVASFILAIFIFPLSYLVGYGLSADNFSYVGRYLGVLVDNPGHLLTTYGNWFRQYLDYKGDFKLALYLPSFPFFLFFMIVFIGVITNPHEFMSTLHGSGRIATYMDVRKMKLFSGFIIVLGRFKGKLLKLPETLSALVVAPPGTGKTVAVVIPTILESHGLSIIVNDPKPELCFKTSGYRQTMGPVFIINWGAEDDPAQGVFYPNWNPLSAVCIPAPGPGRDMYIDSMVAVLVEEAKGGADPHWYKTGRNALAGFLHFICSKCEKARANDYFISRLYEETFDDEDAKVLETYYLDMVDVDAATALQRLREGMLTLENYVPIGTWEGLPEYWVGAEPCIALILDWLTEAQMKIAADIKRRVDEGDQMAMLADPMRDMLDAAVAEARKFGYAHRCVVELSQLAGTPDKERGSILSTGLTGIGIFKNSAVRARTKNSDFTFADLRGMKDPITGEMNPIAVYLSVNQVDARALSLITGIFVELMSGYLIANTPNMVRPDGKTVGPYPVLFVLDEFPQMPKLAAVKDGPAVGRGQKVSYLLIGQDLGQISGQYGKDDLETIITTTAAKVILAQNNEQTAKRFETMIGTRTVESLSSSRTEGWSRNVTPFASNVTRGIQGTSVITASEMLSLPATQQIVLMQGFLMFPIRAESPRWFLDKSMVKKCSLPPAPNVPYWIVAQREDTDSSILSQLMVLEKDLKLEIVDSDDDDEDE
ncbi:MAG: type IV secretory system conjugative DNA transfer family protein [Alphaproteobacteria bacterium]|nr:type IV secretory system conjugative DNA transfer family protein [Alphaproteobacteria bacterium]